MECFALGQRTICQRVGELKWLICWLGDESQWRATGGNDRDWWGVWRGGVAGWVGFPQQQSRLWQEWLITTAKDIAVIRQCTTFGANLKFWSYFYKLHFQLFYFICKNRWSCEKILRFVIWTVKCWDGCLSRCYSMKTAECIICWTAVMLWKQSNRDCGEYKTGTDVGRGLVKTLVLQF